MKILAVETSCDETAVAVVEAQGDEKSAEFKILGDALLSQIELHQPYGGVYPTLAKREHIKNLPVILEQALTQAKLTVADVDAIAVTAGPGLEPALWTGIEFAKKLATDYSKPLVPVNHMEGHILSALASKGTQGGLEIKDVQLPVLALLISGGHTELVLMKNWLEYELIGQTLDDAVGEAFDKVARMMNLPYPGGPQISKLAEQKRSEDAVPSEKGLPRVSTSPPERLFSRAGGTSKFSAENYAYPSQGGTALKLPRPMIHDNTCNFSFAGLKTAVLYTLKDIELTDEKKKEVAHEFEEAVGEVLWEKTRRALDQTGAKTLVLGGGVSANTHIRRVFTEKIAEYSGVALRIPTASLTTDNALMIALAGYYRALRKNFATDIRASGNLSLA